MRVRIINPDGIAASTRIELINNDGTPSETPLDSLRVTRIELECQACGAWTGKLYVAFPRAEIVADVDVDLLPDPGAERVDSGPGLCTMKSCEP